MSDLVQALDALYRLNVGVVGSDAARHERPHKPLLLLAVLEALDAGEATPDNVPWSRALIARFGRGFDIVKAADDDSAPQLPFLHLRGDGLWEPLRSEPGGPRPLEAKPSMRDADAGTVWARFTGVWRVLAGDPVARAAMRDALVSRYFPRHRAALLPGAAEPMVAEAEQEEVRRSPAFRRMVLENYDHQCCACGLRILIPDLGVSFVDAAHLIPFAENRDDHPTNGMALCKHHHWAMDQRLLAPGPDGHWHVSRRVDPRRSPGEADLVLLSGRTLLLPTEPAYAPATDALEWRLSRLA